MAVHFGHFGQFWSFASKDGKKAKSNSFIQHHQIYSSQAEVICKKEAPLGTLKPEVELQDARWQLYI